MSLPLLSRRYLRKATRREHAAAEETAVMLALFEGQLSGAVYIRLLQGYYALYVQWEAQHAPWLAGDLRSAGWPYRSRLPAIEADLRALGAHDLGAPLAGAPRQPPALAAPDVGGAEPDAASREATDSSWGSLYVVEGSALGGQVIARKLAAEFPGCAHHFFTMGHGNGQPTWRDFQTLLDAQLGTAIARRAVALQARDTFGLFQRMLEKVVD